MECKHILCIIRAFIVFFTCLYYHFKYRKRHLSESLFTSLESCEHCASVYKQLPLSSKRHCRIMPSKKVVSSVARRRKIQLSAKFRHQLCLAHISKTHSYNSPHSLEFPKRPKLPLLLYLLWLTLSPYDIFTQLKALSILNIISMRNSTAPGCQHQCYSNTIPSTHATHTYKHE